MVRKFDRRRIEEQAGGWGAQSKQDTGLRDTFQFQGVRGSVELSLEQSDESLE